MIVNRLTVNVDRTFVMIFTSRFGAIDDDLSVIFGNKAAISGCCYMD